MYADELTDSMEKAIKETNRRRTIQVEYNKKHNIVPKSIQKDVFGSIKATFSEEEQEKVNIDNIENVEQTIERLTEEMMSYARKYEFEKAAAIRDFIEELKGM
jgi:excinuclease ABC subunit B